MTETDPPRGQVNRVAVIIPTYNERENLESIHHVPAGPRPMALG